jgi:hypothetical protein
MKRFTLFLTLAAVLTTAGSWVSAQSTINFETLGHDWTWGIFENGDNAAELFSVVDNPSATGINTSAKVAKFVVNANGMPWAGIETIDFPDMTFTADNSIVKVMVYKDVISDFTVKFENANASVAFEKKVSNTVINQWEELTFNFADKVGTSVTRLVIIPDFPTARTAGSVNYFDNISFHEGDAPVLTGPQTAAPVPTPAPANVISLHSSAYTNVGVDTWRTGWSNASYTEVDVAGRATKKYTDLVFVGIETTGGNLIDAREMTHFNVDIWTPDMSTFRVKLVDFGANGVWAGGDDVEHELTFTPELSKWVSLKINLADFTGLITRAHIAQLIFSGSPAGTVYIDNVYFSKDVSTHLVNANTDRMVSLFPNPTQGQLQLKATEDIQRVELRNVVGQLVKSVELSGLETTLDLSGLSEGNYFVSIMLKNGLTTTQKIVKQ